MQIKNVPIMCMDEEIYTGIGKLIGKVQEMDTYRTVDCMGQVIRMIILVDITKPLKKVLFIETEDGKKFQLQWSMRNFQFLLLLWMPWTFKQRMC